MYTVVQCLNQSYGTLHVLASSSLGETPRTDADRVLHLCLKRQTPHPNSSSEDAMGSFLQPKAVSAGNAIPSDPPSRLVSPMMARRKLQVSAHVSSRVHPS